MSLGRALARSLDAAQFARDAGISELDDWQLRLLQEKPARIICCCSRQVGKSLVSALLALECAVHEPYSLVILAAPSVRQSSELLRKIRELYKNLAEHGGD